eukprot:m.206733 g.206733  ORF g.206733 m.206733 type:complete len:166 (-) comp18505_c1_seq5:79-576(-)
MFMHQEGVSEWGRVRVREEIRVLVFVPCLSDLLTHWSSLTSQVRATMTRTPNPYDPTALSYKTGDLIVVLERLETGRWFGSCEGRSGHFPFTEVEPLDSSDPEYEYLPSVQSLEIDGLYSKANQAKLHAGVFNKEKSKDLTEPPLNNAAANPLHPPTPFISATIV